MMQIYYLYYWLNLDKNYEVVYVGKGQKSRYKETHRNIYFNRTYEKYNIKPFIIIKNLTEEKAFELEKEHIKFWKNRGQAKTNLHEGGFGGDVFKYNPEGKALMIARNSLANSGKNNAMYGKDWRKLTTPEKIEKHRINCSKGQLKKYEDINERLKTSEATKKMWNKEGHKEKYRLNNSKRWHQYDLEGNYLRTFTCRIDVLEYLNKIGHMTLVKNERLRKPYKGYYWKQELEKGVETIEKGKNYFHLVE